VAGISNGVAGGGTFITFPTLLALGLPPITANVTSSVGVLPSYVGGIHGFRHEIVTHRRLLVSLIVPCIIGTAAGTVLLFAAPSSTFRAIVPWLIAGGTVLFGAAPLITRRLEHLDHTHPSRRWIMVVGVALVALYGGYFGAGLGILLLSVMAVALPLSILELQGIRSVISTLINFVAAVIFIVRGHLDWTAAGLLFVGSALGGLLGTMLIKRLSATTVRVLIVVIGAATAIRLLI
jgi:uncharacterized membrane protein YfcA